MSSDYGSIESGRIVEEDTPLISKKSTIQEAAPEQKSYLNWKLVVGVTATVAALLFMVSSSTSFIPSKKASSVTAFNKRKSVATEEELVWTIYKHTVSITTGSYSKVADFVNSYITDVDLVFDLGCNASIKVVGSLGVPSNDVGVDGFEEIHWVDSSTFTQSGMTIGEWADYIDSLGTDTFNAFLNNKVQLYVPDLSANYELYAKDGVSTINRLSMSYGSSTYDTAHIGIFIPEASTIYEMVGPASSLTSTQLESFSTWSTEECEDANTLAYSIDYYYDLYSSITFNDADTAWAADSGLYVPMGISVVIPTSSLDYVSGVMTMVESISGVESTTVSNDADTCSVQTANFASDDHFEVIVRYVANSGASQGTTYTIADWEEQIATTHATYVSNSAEYSGWDRYQDTHLGVMSSYYDTSSCTSAESAVLSAIADTDDSVQYSPRQDPSGLHYYVANVGLKSWEFNAYNCSDVTVTDICGCIPDNNNFEYLATTGSNCQS